MKYGLKRVKNRHYDSLSQIPWDRLESMLAVYYAAHGYKVEHVGTGKSGKKFDGGIDLKLRNEDEYIVVQVKHWNACKVPHNDVHQLLGLKVNEGATAAILITSGEFTQAAIEAAKRQGHVELIDGVALREMIGPFTEFVDAKPVPVPKPASIPEISFTMVRRKEEEIPKSVQVLLAFAALIFFLFVIRSVIGNLKSTFNDMGQRTVERAQQSAQRAKAAAEARLASAPIYGTFASTSVAIPPTQPNQQAQPKYESWEATPISREPEQSYSRPSETAAERKAREAFLKSVPEV